MATNVELALNSAVFRQLDSDDKSYEQLTDPQGPLSTFSQKIILGRATSGGRPQASAAATTSLSGSIRGPSEQGGHQPECVPSHLRHHHLQFAVVDVP
jgi:hypothetical protein